MGSVRRFGHLKARASSLVEVTVAMVIFVLVFSMALVVFARVTTSGSTSKRMKYELLASGHAAAAVEERQFVDDEVLLQDGSLLIRQVTPYGGDTGLLQLGVMFTGPHGDTLGVHRQLVYVAAEN